MAKNPPLLRWTAMTSEWASVPLSGFVWEQDGRVVGNVSLIPYNVRRQRFYLIANVAVHPDYRRQGVARLLTIRALERARQRRMASVWLHVRETNATAVKLYQDLGFSEHTRRTTWNNKPGYSNGLISPGLEFIPLRARHWQEQREWLKNDYPREFCWHLRINSNMLRPGLLGWFDRLMNNVYIKQWGALLDGRLLGAASLYAPVSGSNELWLAIPPDGDESVAQGLLLHARQHLHPKRSLILDYPARRFDQAIQAAGFSEHQTLIWMSLSLDE